MHGIVERIEPCLVAENKSKKVEIENRDVNQRVDDVVVRWITKFLHLYQKHLYLLLALEPEPFLGGPLPRLRN